MKILHCADLHFQNDKEILEDISKCANFVIEAAKVERPDFSVIAGDIFDDKALLDSHAVRCAIEFVIALGSVAPALLLRGTHSHDHDSLHVFRNVRSTYPVYVADSIGQVSLTERGFVPISSGASLKGAAKAVISCLPSVSKAYFLAHGRQSIHEADIQAAELLKDVFRGWGEINQEARTLGIPVILVAHGSLMGAVLSNGQQMIGRDIEFGIEDLFMANADIYCLGHIHKSQHFKNVFYSGSITRLNHGEEEDKGFWVHEIGESLSSRFVKTPAKKMLTIDMGSPEDFSFIDAEKVKDAAVRVRYEVSEEEIHRFNEGEIEAALLTAGVLSVKFQRKVIPKQRVRAEGISRAGSLKEKVVKWGEVVGETIPDSVISKIDLLERPLQDVVAAVEAAVFSNGVIVAVDLKAGAG